MLNFFLVNIGTDYFPSLDIWAVACHVLSTWPWLLVCEVLLVEMFAPEDTLAAVENPLPDGQVVPLLELLQTVVWKTVRILALGRIIQEIFAELELQHFVDGMHIGAARFGAFRLLSELAKCHPELDVCTETLQIPH